jgi:hypothetical protein
MASKALPPALCSDPGLRQAQCEGLVLSVPPDFIGHQRRQDGGVTYYDYARALQPLRFPGQKTPRVVPGQKAPVMPAMY